MEPQYKVLVKDREYTSTQFINMVSGKEELLSLNALEHKMFNNDAFTLSATNKVNVVNITHSITRVGGELAGVLILHNNKTYGNKNGRLLYKCIPDDKRLPIFLVPYEMKNIGFSKVFINKYVTFHFSEWSMKHPYGTISQTIGTVDILDNFYEYQLYCKSLHSSINKFTKDTSAILKTMPPDTFIDNISKKYPSIEDRTNNDIWQIFTIDPPNSTDFDDAISIKNNDQPIIQLSIYISNVTIWLDELQLWESFSRRISTIYLPDKKRPMLPTILSDCLCSLQEGNKRIAFVLDLFIDTTSWTVLSSSFSNCIINVFKNFRYEEEALLKNTNYTQIIGLAKGLSRQHKYISHIKTSHDVVSYLMILMNHTCAQQLHKHQCGIFRSSHLSAVSGQTCVVGSPVPEDVQSFLKIWTSSCGQYIDLANFTSEENPLLKHDFLNVDAYVHITSPIRRIVDLLNIIKFQQVCGQSPLIELSPAAEHFYNKWTAELEYINITMRSIRKIQSDCTLLDLCHTNPETLDKIFDGYVFDKVVRNDSLYQFTVYLPELRLVSRVVIKNDIMSEYNSSAFKFKLYLFNNEDNFKKKIRLMLIYDGGLLP